MNRQRVIWRAPAPTSSARRRFLPAKSAVQCSGLRCREGARERESVCVCMLGCVCVRARCRLFANVCACTTQRGIACVRAKNRRTSLAQAS